MREHLKQYVTLLFTGTENTDDIRQEILQNTLDRYDDLIAQGKTPEAAYQLAISGIGDIREILNSRSGPQSEELTPVAAAPVAEPAPEKPRRPVWKRFLLAVGIALYLLSPLPLLLLPWQQGLYGLLALCAVATVFTVTGANGKPSTRTGAKKVLDIILTVVSLCVYLAVSFMTGAWIVSWLLFPLFACIRGFLFALIDLILHTVVRGKAIVKIVIFSILIPLLACFAVNAVGMNAYIVRFGPGNYQKVAAAETVCLEADTASRLTVSWVAGDVDIQTADTDEISFHAEAVGSDRSRLAWQLSGDTLSIRQEALLLSGLGSTRQDLTVTVPADWACKELEIRTVSGRVTVNGLTGQAAKAAGTSAALEFVNCNFADLSLSTVSGDCAVELGTAMDDVEVDTVSGAVTVTAAPEQGYTARLDTVIGKLHTVPDTAEQGKYRIYGDGQCRIDIDSVSGHAYIILILD